MFQSPPTRWDFKYKSPGTSDESSLGIDVRRVWPSFLRAVFVSAPCPALHHLQLQKMGGGWIYEYPSGKRLQFANWKMAQSK